LLLVLLMAVILIEVRWNLSVILICISFMTKDTEHFFHLSFGHMYFFFWKLACSIRLLIIGLFLLLL
jgi:hypothetical protein